MTASRLLQFLCISFVGGIFFASFLDFSESILLAILIFSLFLISVFWKDKRIVVFGLCVIFVLFGFERCQQVEGRDPAKETEGTFIVTVCKNPDMRETSQRLTVKGDFPGKALIILFRYPEYKYGDELEIKGKLEKPELLDGFNYPGYLAKSGVYLVSYRPEVRFLSSGNGNFLFSWIYEINGRLKEVIVKNLPQGHAALLSAMVLGDMSKLPEGLEENLNLSGVRHLTSISGTHVSILSSILMSFLLGIGLWRKKAFWITIFLISFFILFTGLQPPAIRSGIMGVCFLTSKYLGRQNSSLRAVVLSAGIMLFLNPLLLVFDIGFQLSFLAILGILLLTPVFEKWFHRIPQRFQIREITAISLAAQIFTLPVLVFNFGQFSLIAPLANLFIVPVLPHIMILGFIFSLAGLLFAPLGFLFSIPCLILLEYLIISMGWFANLPFSALFFSIPGSWVFVYYWLLSVLVVFLTKKLKKYSF